MLTQTLIDALSDGAVIVADNKITSLNQEMLRYFPTLATGKPLPQELHSIAEAEAGTLFIGGIACIFTHVPTEDGLLILLRDAPAQQIYNWQLDGITSSLRTQIAEFVMGIEVLSRQTSDDNAHHLDTLQKTIHQMNRLVSNISFLQEPIPAFAPVTMDFSGLCSQLTQTLSTLMHELSINLTLDCDSPAILIHGDPVLIHRMLLGLLSNSIHNARGGFINLRLSLRNHTVILTLTDSGFVDVARPLSDLLAGKGHVPFPHVGEGAGLGLPIIRRILSFHGGTILLRRSDTGGVETTIALPIKKNGTDIAVNAPDVHYDTGFSPLLTELSDVLPAHIFNRNDLQG